MVEETNGAKKKIGCGGSPAILALPSLMIPRPAAGRRYTTQALSTMPPGRWQAEGVKHRASAREARLPIGLTSQLRFGVADAAANRLGRERHEAVVVPDHQVARRHDPPAEGDRPVHGSPLGRGGSARRH